MGGVVSAIECAVCSVASAVGCAVETVACTVGDVVQSAVNNPVQTMMDVVAVATGNPELIPLINGAMTLATTGCITKALETGAVSYVAQGVMGGMCISGACGAEVPSCLPDVTEGGGSLPSGCVPSTCLPTGCTPSICAPTCNPSMCMGCGAVCSGFYCGTPVCAPTCLPCMPTGCTPSFCVPCSSGGLNCMAGCCAFCAPCCSTMCNSCTPTPCCATTCDTCMPCGCTPSNCTPCGTCCSTTCDTGCCSACCGCCSCCSCCSCCCACDCNMKIKKPKIKFKKNKGVTGKNPKSSGKIKNNGSSCCSSCGSGSMTCSDLKSALGASFGALPKFLCGSATMLNNSGGSGCKGGLKTVYKGSILPKASACNPMSSCEYAMECRKALLGQCCGGGLGYATGGSADCTSCTPTCAIEENRRKNFNAVQTWKDSFSDKNLTPSFVCGKPEFLQGSGQPAKIELTPLKHIKQSISCGFANGGGLPSKYQGASPRGHNPEFITGVTGYYACGGGTGQSDDIPAMLHDGDYVMDAETVSALGDGSSKAGKHVLDGFRKQVPHKDGGGVNPVPAKIADGEYVFPASFVTSLGGGDNKRGAEILDGLRTKLRAHKRGAPLDKIPPKAKDPIDYIKKGSK